MAPATVLAVKFNVVPSHIGLLLFISGGLGLGAAPTTIVSVAAGQLVLSDTETIYVPGTLTLIALVVCPPGLHK